MALSSHTLRKSVRLNVWGWSTLTLLAKSVRVVIPNTFASHSVRTGYFLKLATGSRQSRKATRLKNYFQRSELTILRNILNIWQGCRRIPPLRMIAAATAKTEIRRGPFASLKILCMLTALALARREGGSQ